MEPTGSDEHGEPPEPHKENEPAAGTGFSNEEIDKMTQSIDPALLALLGLC